MQIGSLQIMAMPSEKQIDAMNTYKNVISKWVVRKSFEEHEGQEISVEVFKKGTPKEIIELFKKYENDMGFPRSLIKIDDYDEIVNSILLYLYTQLDCGEDIDTECLLNPHDRHFKIDDMYYMYIMKRLSDEGLVSGVNVVEREHIWLYVDNLDKIEITVQGIDYILEQHNN